MITPSFNLTATERVLPRLALDFTTASLDPRVTFTRSGNTATVTNSSGYVVGINADLPRFDYDPITLVCKGLLIEEARTNLLLQSQTFQTTWTVVRSSVSADATTAPDNLTTGDKLVEDTTASNTHFVNQAVALSALVYTYSVYLKASERTWARLTLLDGVTTFGAYFNLSTGAIGVLAGGATAAVSSVGNGWYRCSITTTTATATATGNARVILATGDNGQTYTGDGTSGIFMWGAQLEAGAFPTSYIPTTTTALTRNADIATMTGTNFSDWYNATQGTFLTDVEAKTSSFAAYFGGASGNEMYTRVAASGPTFVVVTGGSTQANFGASALTSKIANSYKENRFLTCTNAGTVAGDVLGTIPVVSSLTLGSAPTSSRINGTIKRFSYYSIQLTVPEVQAISK